MKIKLTLASLIVIGALINQSCTKETEGCMISFASNYNPEATLDDGSCIYEDEEMVIDTGNANIDTTYWRGNFSAGGSRLVGVDGDTKASLSINFDGFEKHYAVDGYSVVDYFPASDFERYGIVYATHENPTLEDNFVDFEDIDELTLYTGTTSFTGFDIAWTGKLNGLNPGKKYYIAAFTVLNGDIEYSSANYFYTSDGGTVVGKPGGGVTDVSGNSYPTVTYINGQEWMAVDLEVHATNDGVALNLGLAVNSWSEETEPSFGWWEGGDVQTVYNGHAVNTGKLCPTGWRIPNLDDIDELKKLMAVGTLAQVSHEEFYLDKSNSTLWSATPNAELISSFTKAHYYREGGHVWDVVNWPASGGKNINAFEAGVRCIKE